MKKEKWLEVRGYEGYYEVSDMGRVKSTRVLQSGEQKEHILSPNKPNRGINGTGVCTVGFSLHCVKKYYSVSRLVAEHFVHNDNPKEKTRVIHKDDNLLNLKASNLEWVTEQERTVRLHTLNKTTHSKYTGISYHKVTGKWVAYAPGAIWLGSYRTEKEAREVRKEYVIKNNLLTKFDKI